MRLVMVSLAYLEIIPVYFRQTGRTEARLLIRSTSHAAAPALRHNILVQHWVLGLLMAIGSTSLVRVPLSQ